jgi:hypothetical protein
MKRNILSSIISGYEWKSKARLCGLPLVHIAFGRDQKTGRLLAAKGIIAIGQFGLGVISIAQFGVGIVTVAHFGIGGLFCLAQFAAGIAAVGQFAAGIAFGLGQFATGYAAIAQYGWGNFVLAPPICGV